MNAMLAIAKLLAHDAGTAHRVTRQRAFPISPKPLVLIPIVMAGESPSLFGLGVGDGRCVVQRFVCPNPINRDEQYAMLAAAWKTVDALIQPWHVPDGPGPQIIVTGGDSARLVLAIIDRTVWSRRTDLSATGRALFWFDKRSDCPDSACLLVLPTALGACLATGQDEFADQHLGAFLEWCEPADGKVWERVAKAEQQPASGATSPEFDRDYLEPAADEYAAALRAGHSVAATRGRKKIEKLIGPEIDRRYALAKASLRLLARFPESAAAAEVAEEDGRSFREHAAYIADPNHHLRRGLDRKNQTSEFMSREFTVGRMAGLGIRHVSSAFAQAQLAGDLLEGDVVNSTRKKVVRTTTVTQTIASTQQLSLRSGDKLSLIADERFVYRVNRVEAAANGSTMVTLEVTSGKTLPGLPAPGDRVALAPPLQDRFALSRARRIAWDRMRAKPAAVPAPAAITFTRDWAGMVAALKGKA